MIEAYGSPTRIIRTPKQKMEFVLFFYNDYFGIKVETNVQKKQNKPGV